MEKYNAKLLILDPMSSYIGDTCSMNNANETRAEFNHLIAVAKDTGCAIVIIAHMNKAKDTSPLYRTNGSIDIAGAARSILAVTRTANKQNPAERYLVQVKSNLAPMGSAILFEVADKGVNFLDELELSAEDAFSASAPRMGRPNAREEAATDFIRSLLAGGRRLASDCEAKLEAAGFKKSTYKKSKKKAGVRSVKDGFLWYWTCLLYTSQLVCRAADYRQAERLPCRPQRAGRSIVFSAGKAAFRKRGRNGSPQRGKSNAVGTEDEQHPQCCYGNRCKRFDLLLGGRL